MYHRQRMACARAGKHGASVVIVGRRGAVVDKAVAQLQSEQIDAEGCSGDVRSPASTRPAPPHPPYPIPARLRDPPPSDSRTGEGTATKVPARLTGDACVPPPPPPPQEDAERAVKFAVEKFGCVDILVNCAAGNFLALPEGTCLRASRNPTHASLFFSRPRRTHPSRPVPGSHVHQRLPHGHGHRHGWHLQLLPRRLPGAQVRRRGQGRRHHQHQRHAPLRRHLVPSPRLRGESGRGLAHALPRARVGLVRHPRLRCAPAPRRRSAENPPAPPRLGPPRHRRRPRLQASPPGPSVARPA